MSGDSGLPWGVPAPNFTSCDQHPLKKTVSERFERKELRNLVRRFGSPRFCFSLYLMPLCQHLSKAASASKKRAATIWLFLNDMWHCSEIRRSCSEVICFALNPLCDFENRLLFSICIERRRAISRSSNLPRQLSRDMGRKFFASLVSFPGLGIRIVFALLQAVGKYPNVTQEERMAAICDKYLSGSRLISL